MGKRVLVTGGTRGIGRATTLAFACAGARVIACYRSDDAAASALAAMPAWDPRRHRTVRADLLDPADLSLVVAECADWLGGLDVLVNNVGLYQAKPLAETSPADVKQVIDANLTVHQRITQAVLPLLGTPASIVNLGASLAARGRPGHAHYTAAKAGIIGLTRSLGKELGPRSVRVNAVAPGIVQTERGLEMPALVADQLRAAIPLGRFCAVQDVAHVVLFLASDLSSFVNGATVNVDGGLGA